MDNRFYSARLKIKRANEHINDLYQRGQIFSEDRSHSITVERDFGTGDDSLRVTPAEPLPDELLLVLGDAVHNLRAALDHAWMQVVKVPGDFTKFPVRETCKSLEAAVGGLKENATEEIKRFIVDVVQPYGGGRGEWILGLHDLDIEDKHRLLIAHREFSSVNGVVLKDEEGDFSVPGWLVVAPHSVSTGFVGHQHFEIANYGHSITHIAFGEGSLLHGRNVYPTLRNMSDGISRLIDCFEKILAAE